MRDSHQVPVEELNLGDTSASGQEFTGAVIYVKVDDEKKIISVFTNAERTPKDPAYAVSPHYGYLFSPGKKIIIDTAASEDVRAAWVKNDFAAPEFGNKVALAYRKALAQQRAHGDKPE